MILDRGTSMEKIQWENKYEFEHETERETEILRCTMVRECK